MDNIGAKKTKDANLKELYIDQDDLIEEQWAENQPARTLFLRHPSISPVL